MTLRTRWEHRIALRFPINSTSVEEGETANKKHSVTRWYVRDVSVFVRQMVTTSLTISSNVVYTIIIYNGRSFPRSRFVNRLKTAWKSICERRCNRSEEKNRSSVEVFAEARQALEVARHCVDAFRVRCYEKISLTAERTFAAYHG